MQFGFLSLLALVAANMIGTGIFTTTGYSLAGTGSADAVMVAWFLGALHCLMGVRLYQILARQVRRGGGEYTIATELLSPAIGFQCGWVSFLAGFSGPIAVAAQAFNRYSGISAGWALIAAVFLIQWRSPLWAIRFQNIFVYLKVAALLLLSLIAFFWTSRQGLQPEPVGSFKGLEAWMITFVWVLFAYSGWNSFVYVIERYDQNSSVLMRAPYVAAGLVSVLYLSLNFVFLYRVPANLIVGQAEVGKIAAEYWGGPSLAVVIAVLISVGLATALSAMTMTGSEVLRAMASDLFRREIKLQSGLILQTALALVFYFSSSLTENLSILGYLLSLSNAIAAVGIYSRRFTSAKTAFDSFFVGPLFILISVVASVVLIVGSAKAILMCSLYVLAGFGLYQAFRLRSKTQN